MIFGVPISKKVLWFLIPFLLLTLIISLLPVAAKFAAIHLLEKQGASTVDIEDIDFNVFTAVLTLDDFAMTYEDLSSVELERLTINLSALALFSKTIEVQSLEMDGLVLRAVNQGDRLLLGLPVPLVATPTPTEKAVAEDENTAPWSIALPSITFRNLQLDYTQENLQSSIVLDRVTLTDFTTGNVDQPLDFALKGEVNGSSLALAVAGTPLATPRQLNINIELDRFPLSSLGGLIREQLPELAGFLSINTAVEIQQADQGVTARQYGAIVLDDIAGDLSIVSNQPLTLDSLHWSWVGQTSVETDADLSPQTLSARGTMRSGNSRLRFEEPDMLLEHRDLSWKGGMSLRDMNINQQLHLTGDLKLGAFNSESSQAGLQPVSFTDLAINGIELQGLNRILARQFDIHNLVLLNPGPEVFPDDKNPILHQQRISLSGITVGNQQQLTVDKTELQGMRAAIRLNEQKQIPLLDALSSLTASAQQAPKTNSPDKALKTDTEVTETSKKPEAEPFQFHIKELQFAGTNTLTLLDQSVTPQYQQTLDISKLLLSNIRNDKPEEPMQLSLQARLDEHSSIDLQGKLQVFSEKKNIDLDGNIKNVNLIKLSPYVSQQTGYNIHTGALDAELDIRVNNDQLDVVNKLKLQNIRLTPDKQEKIEKLTRNLTMPLDQALNILRDKNDNVELEVPIKGDINNPEFGIQDVINTAMTKALKTATVSYLKTFLQPYGTAITVVQLVGNYAMKIRLEPLIFEPGVTLLNEPHQSYLNELVTRMKDKDALRLRACGVAATSELAIEDAVEKENRLSQLGQERANQVRQYFIDQGIAADRLFTCNPEIDSAEKAEPRVELAM